MILLLLTILLPLAPLPEWKRCWPCFKDNIEKEQLWSLMWQQDGTNVSFISHIHKHFLSSVISLIVLPMLLSLAVLLTVSSLLTVLLYLSVKGCCQSVLLFPEHNGKYTIWKVFISYDLTTLSIKLYIWKMWHLLCL